MVYRLPTRTVTACVAEGCDATSEVGAGPGDGWSVGPHSALCPDHRPALRLPVAVAA